MQGIDLFSATWYLTIAITLFAAFIRGISGFGFALVFAPIMLLIMEPKSVVVVNLFLGLSSNIVVLVSGFKNLHFRRLIPLIIGCLAGIPLGLLIISVVSQSTLKILIGSVTVVFAILFFLKLTPRFKNEKPASTVAGFLSGVLTSSTSLGGPPVVLFMHTQDWQKDTIHPALSAYFMFSTISSLIGLAITGVINTKILLTTASLVPALIIGVLIGVQAFKRVNERIFRLISIFVIVGTGIVAVLSGLGIIG